MLVNCLINIYFSWQDNVKLLKIEMIITSVLLILYDIFAGAYVYIASKILFGGTALFLLWVERKTLRNKKSF